MSNNQDEKDGETKKLARLEAFKRRQDSVRLPASRVSAMAGFHPYASLPQLLLDLVYQGTIGSELLQYDSSLLGLDLRTEEQILMDLARRAGDATSQAFQAALEVHQGLRKLADVDAARVLKSRVFEEAQKSKKLSENELRILQEGSRSLVDKAFGSYHENDALDLYEKRCGWEVRERNDCFLSWSFLKEEGVRTPVSPEPSVVPMTDIAIKEQKKEACGAPLKVENQESGQAKKDKKEQKANEILQSVRSNSADDCEKQRPFFSICGKIDGVRDELWFSEEASKSNEENDDDDGWRMRTVVVECKHRMRKPYHTPPLFEQIQTCVYCRMVSAEEADIIQVVRKASPVKKRPMESQKEASEAAKPPKACKTDDTCKGDGANVKTPVIMGGPTVPDSPVAPKTPPKDNLRTPPRKHRNVAETTPPSTQDGNKEEPDETTNNPPEVDIVVSRISLNDPIMGHKENWEKVVLPRLRSFVEAMYKVREEDSLRYSLLQSISDDTRSQLHVCWKMLHDLCPWLEHCDTAFLRETQPQQRGTAS